MKMIDGLINFAAQLGVGKSKMASDQFIFTDISYRELDALYRGDWLGRKIIDTPVFDMFREWRDWKAEGNQITAIEDAEDRHQVRDKLAMAVRMARLWGGSGILIGADVGNPSLPLNLRAIGRGGLKYLTVLSREDLHVSEIDRDPRNVTFGQPLRYTLNSQTDAQIEVHPSRVLRFVGNERLDWRTNVDGWGDSVLLSIYDAIHHAALSQKGIADLIHEAKVDVIKIPDLTDNLSTTAGENKLLKRFAVANQLKSINNMLLLGGGEEWERKQTSFAGLPDILDRYLQIVAGASDIPATRLLGMSAKGLNATGEGDLRNYYDMLAAQRQMTIGANLQKLDDILWRDATGSVPAKVYAEWRPMWQMTPKEKADIAKTKAETTNAYFNMGAFDEQTFAEVVSNQLIEDGTYPGLEDAIKQLRSSIPRIEQREAEAEAIAAQNDNPQANRSNASDRIRLTYSA